MKKNIAIAILIIIGSVIFLKYDSKFSNVLDLIPIHSGIRIGWIQHSDSRHIEASYKKFSGTVSRKVKFNKGDVVDFTYDVEVLKGELIAEIFDSEGNLIKVLELKNKGKEKLQIEYTDKYIVKITGKNTKGNFNMKWEKGV